MQVSHIHNILGLVSDWRIPFKLCLLFSGMDVGARNRLLECSDCHSLYHQECHKPGVTEDSFENWVCFSCKVSCFYKCTSVVLTCYVLYRKQVKN